MKKQNGLSMISLVIIIVLLIVAIGVAVKFLGGDNGLVSQVANEEKEYNKNEIIEDLNEIITEKYLEEFKKASDNKELDINSLYNATIVKDYLIEKCYIEEYLDKENNKVENTYFINKDLLKRDIKNYGKGENGKEKDLYIVEINIIDNSNYNFEVCYVNFSGEKENIGSLKIEQTI